MPHASTIEILLVGCVSMLLLMEDVKGQQGHHYS